MYLRPSRQKKSNWSIVRIYLSRKTAKNLFSKKFCKSAGQVYVHHIEMRDIFRVFCFLLPKAIKTEKKMKKEEQKTHLQFVIFSHQNHFFDLRFWWVKLKHRVYLAQKIAKNLFSKLSQSCRLRLELNNDLSLNSLHLHHNQGFAVVYHHFCKFSDQHTTAERTFQSR